MTVLIPISWPPEPSLGSLEEMKNVLGMDGNYITGLHDNYQDMYEGRPSFPKGLNVLPSGELMNGGYWGGGQAYILNSRSSLEYAKRNWAMIKDLNPKAMFIDTLSASKLLESYEKNNTLSKTQDQMLKIELLGLFKNAGKLVGSEEGCEFVIPLADWFENRHNRIGDGTTIPLWPLVFHDAVICYRYNSFKNIGQAPVWLEDMLWGYALHFFMDTSFGRIKNTGGSEKIGFGASEMDEEAFKGTFHVDEWHQRIGTAEMLSHRFLTEDFKVEETIFEPGISIICNFSNEDRTVEGKNIKAYSYLIKD